MLDVATVARLRQIQSELKVFLPPEHHIVNPADQRVETSPCRQSTACEYSFEVKKSLEKSSSGSGSIYSSVKTGEESLLRGGEKLASLLADLLGFPGADRQPEANVHRVNLYVSMSPAFGHELKSIPTALDSQQEKRAVIYENCLKCQSKHCHPPPQVVPAEMYRNRNTSPLQTFSAGLKRNEEHEAAVNIELLSQAPSDGPQSGDRLCQFEEMSGRAVVSEGKRPLHQFPLRLITKLLRSLWCPFPL